MISYLSPATRKSLNQALPEGKAVIYWMVREQRVDNNQSLWVAQELVLRNKSPLIVVFCLRADLSQSLLLPRAFEFMWQGLQEVAQKLESLNISFKLLIGEPEIEIKKLVKQSEAGLVVTDLFPIKPYTHWQEKLKKSLSVPLLIVDGHNSIPVWEVSDKAEYAARTIRPKIWKQAPKFHDWSYQVKKHPVAAKSLKNKTDWKKLAGQIKLSSKVWDQKLESQLLGKSTLKPGYKAAHQFLKKFIKNGLPSYEQERNDPSLDGTSHLSAYLHFGQLSSLEVVQAIKKAGIKGKVKDAFLEELIVRKELADNFCFYSDDCRQLTAAPEWAQQTLADHADDKRQTYSKSQFLWAETDDPAWNAAQKQLLKTGYMHGYMRMYWAKKILEWSRSPRQALEIAQTLNDLLELDGRDPNGYLGILWSIAGLHDHPWQERKIFGKVRYMNLAGLKRKFKIENYIDQYQD